MIEQSKSWIEFAAVGVEIASSVVIGFAVLEALLRSVPLFVRRHAAQSAKVDVRLTPGRWLALGLESLTADILRTAIAPTWHEIGQLAAIAAPRTTLNFFLAK
jgi:uncharacterized membrane protein